MGNLLSCARFQKTLKITEPTDQKEKEKEVKTTKVCVEKAGSIKNF